jgi:hypothetical protein
MPSASIYSNRSTGVQRDEYTILAIIGDATWRKRPIERSEIQCLSISIGSNQFYNPSKSGAVGNWSGYMVVVT